MEIMKSHSGTDDNTINNIDDNEDIHGNFNMNAKRDITRQAVKKKRRKQVKGYIISMSMSADFLWAYLYETSVFWFVHQQVDKNNKMNI